MMDYEQDEQEEKFEEQAEEPQDEDMEIDEDDAPYLARDDREHQAYAMIKNRSFGHTRAFEPDLLEITGMDVVPVGWDHFVPVEENGSRLLTIHFLCTLREVDDGVSFRLFLELNSILIGEISVTSLVLACACQFLLQKLAAALIDMSFGV